MLKSLWKVRVDCGTKEKAERAIARTFELALPDMRPPFEIELSSPEGVSWVGASAITTAIGTMLSSI